MAIIHSALRFLVLVLVFAPVAASGSGGDVAAQARALIGVAYAPERLGDPIPGSQCTDDGGGFIVADGKDMEGWGLGVATCSKRWVYMLMQLKGYEGRYPKWQVIDTLVLPPLRKGLQVYAMAECSLDGRFDTMFITVARMGRREEVDHRTGVVASWTIDLPAGRFVPISTKRVVCYRPTPP